jgi:hypothetical protein
LELLHHIGDQEIAGNFYADLYQRPALTPLVKFWIAILGGLEKFSSHQRLREVLDAHLKGESPAKVFLRALYPDGRTCRVRKNRLPLQEPRIPSVKRLKGTEQLVKDHFKKTN